MLGRWFKQWLKSTLRAARCNQASKMRMTTSTLVNWGCLAASLSAGHHQERLLGQPLWPHCGFKFPFEGRFGSWFFLMKQLIHNIQGLSGAHNIHFFCSLIFKDYFKRLIDSSIFFLNCQCVRPLTTYVFCFHKALWLESFRKLSNPTWQGPFLRYYISVKMASVTAEALMSGTEVLHQDFGKH